MRILVGVDGSHNSRTALRVLAHRNLREGAVVRLVAVAVGHTLFGFNDHTAEDLAESIVAESAAFLAELAPDVQIETAVLVEGSIASAIVHEAETWKADLIAVGSAGASVIESALLGSCSQKVLSKSSVPVFVARATVPNAEGNILIAVDDSECSVAAVEWLATQWWANGKTISLISILEEVGDAVGHARNITKASDALISWQTNFSSLQIANNYLAKIVEAGLPASTVYHGVLQGEPRDVIVRAAANWPAEVVVLGSHSRKGLSKLILGSVSKYVTATVTCSVENVRGQTSQYYAQLHALVEANREASALAAIPPPPRREDQDTTFEPHNFPMMGSGGARW